MDMSCGARLCPSCTFRMISLSAWMVSAVVKLAPCSVLLTGDLAELAGGDARLEVGADLRVGHLAHAATHGIDEDGAFVEDGLALEAFDRGQRSGRAAPAAVAHLSGRSCACALAGAPAPRPQLCRPDCRTQRQSAGAPPATSAGDRICFPSRVLCAAICAASGPLKPLRATASTICWRRGLEASRYSCE